MIDDAISLIKEFEGFRADAYPDPRTGDEPWTIGYGTTVYANGTKVKRGDKVTEQQASIELIQKVASLRSQLSKLITVPLTDGQMACMVSFAYNMGISGSGLQIARLNKGLVDEFKRKHLEYVNKGSNVEAGLRRRRKAELELFDMEEPPAQWINLVRHGSKAEPDLRAYLMDGDTAISLKRFTTTQDLINILAAHRNAGIAIGEYGWHKEPVDTGAPPVKNGVATLKRTGKRRANGLEILAMEFNGELFECVSGQPYAQSFRRPEHPRSVPGCMEPIPHGDYRIGDIEWAGGKDNYDASWGPGLGPIWIPLKATFSDDRSAFGIHLDSNAGTSPGSAGCVVIPNISELKRLVAALRKHDPKVLKVQWN